MKFWGKAKVEGLIAHHGLADWWLTTFTKGEREYIDSTYQPGGIAHVLTQGRRQDEFYDPTARDLSPRPTPEFLHILQTWFRGKQDASIVERIHRKVVELGQTDPIAKPGYYHGRHYTTHVDDVKNLKRGGKLEEAERLLLRLLEATEEESSVTGGVVPPWYSEQLAIIYRKQKDYAKEVATLERYVGHPEALPTKLLDRLEKARALLARSE